MKSHGALHPAGLAWIAPTTPAGKKSAGELWHPGSVERDQGDSGYTITALLKALAQTTLVDPGACPAFAPGTVAGRFELLRELGQGGFGVVYEVRDQLLGRRVAFKAIAPGRRAAPLGESWLQHEAEAAARLTHPCIVTLHDFGWCEGRPFLIMELLEGESLHERLRRGPMALREAVSVAVEIARALDHAHAVGVLHRDLKPGNVFLTRDGGVKVLDFGLAFIFGAGGIEGCGTPGYAAPEQWRGEAQDARTDVFSAGVVLYELLTGRLPYPIPSEGGAVPEDGPAPAPIVPGIPASLSELVGRALSSDPAGRPEDGKAWLAGLLAVQKELEQVAVAAALVVLPFSELPAPAGDALGDSLSELLIAQLARVPALRVISRTTAMAYRATAKTIPQIGRELGVGHVLEGTALRSNGELRIDVRLFEAEREQIVWTAAFRAAPENALASVDEMSAAVAQALGMTPALPSRGATRADGARAKRAVQDFLRGQYHLGKRTPEGLRAALAEFRAAIDADPLYSPPYVGTAHAHVMSGLYGYSPTHQAFSAARANAQRAMALDPGSGEAASAMASVLFFHDYDFAGALEHARRAVELSPSFSIARLIHGDVLWSFERGEEALAQIREAVRIDPLDPGMGMNVADFLAFGERYAEAVEHLRNLVATSPEFVPGHVRLAKFLALLGERREAHAEAELVRATASQPIALETSAFVLAALREDGARRAIADVEALVRARRANPVGAASAWAILGEHGAALSWLEWGLAERNPMLVLAHVHPPLRLLREDSRFAELARKIGIPRYAGARQA